MIECNAYLDYLMSSIFIVLFLSFKCSGVSIKLQKMEVLKYLSECTWLFSTSVCVLVSLTSECLGRGVVNYLPEADGKSRDHFPGVCIKAKRRHEAQWFMPQTSLFLHPKTNLKYLFNDADKPAPHNSGSVFTSIQPVFLSKQADRKSVWPVENTQTDHLKRM